MSSKYIHEICKDVPDWRHISNGLVIPTESYSDQPYIVKTDDGAWLCTVTTGSGKEGDSGQHVISMRSTDNGVTWSKPADIEPSNGPEASYSVPLKAPGGRIYCFYNHNTDNVRKVKADTLGGYFTRVDSLGYFVFKYSDDHGRTWSHKRYNIPVREFACDRNNADGGKIRYFWNVGKAFIYKKAAYISLHKVGGFGAGFFSSSEGVLLKSENILYETDPEKIMWETLPDGDVGLKTPPGGGPISEEQSYSLLSDGSFYCVYRSVDGHPVEAYSRDGGYTWTEPRYKRYAVGHLMKHPRAANFAWRCSNGKYLYWFHNHGGKCYEDRNPVWVAGGIEVDSPEGRIIAWTQPEILLYDDDTYIRMSYPDLIEEGGRYFITETQKDVARVHEIPVEFLEKLWNQFEINEISQRGIVYEFVKNIKTSLDNIKMPELPVFNARDTTRHDYGAKDLRNGFTVEFWFELSDTRGGKTILDSRLNDGQGLCVNFTDKGTIELIMNDGRTENRWTSDPGMLKLNKKHHVAVVVDGGPKLISFIIDGILCDGNDYRQFGWGRFSPNLRHANGNSVALIGSEGVILKIIRIYDEALNTTEVIANYRAGTKIV